MPGRDPHCRPAAVPPAAAHAAVLLVPVPAPAPYAHVLALCFRLCATRPWLGVFNPSPPAAALTPPLHQMGRPANRWPKFGVTGQAPRGPLAIDPAKAKGLRTIRAGGTSLYHFAAILPRTGPVRGRSPPEDLILPPAPRWGGVVATSLYRSALVATLPRLRLPAPGGEGPPAKEAPASLPAQEPSWPASCLTSPRASCPRLVAGPGVRTAPHRSRALRRPALRPPGSASSTSRACAGQLRSLTPWPASSSWVALCPLRASRLRGRGFARYAATPPPSGTPLPVWGRGPHRCLRSLDASPPSLRFGRLRWPAPCGPSRPWQDGQGSIPARRHLVRPWQPHGPRRPARWRFAQCLDFGCRFQGSGIHLGQRQHRGHHMPSLARLRGSCLGFEFAGSVWSLPVSTTGPQTKVALCAAFWLA